MGEQLTMGQVLRDVGTESVSANTPPDWRGACDRAILLLAAQGKTFTAEDVRLVVGDPPNHPNAMGARFLAAARSGLIEKLGYGKPVRASSHASVIAIWRGRTA
jgi:hypothetical protein